MSRSLQISPDYRKAIVVPLITQGLLLFIAGVTLDGGVLLQICLFTMVAFWSGAAVVVCRRLRSPTRIDLSLIRIGFLPLFALALVLVHGIWHLRSAW